MFSTCEIIYHKHCIYLTMYQNLSLCIQAGSSSSKEQSKSTESVPSAPDELGNVATAAAAALASAAVKSRVSALLFVFLLDFMILLEEWH